MKTIPTIRLIQNIRRTFFTMIFFASFPAPAAWAGEVFHEDFESYSGTVLPVSGTGKWSVALATSPFQTLLVTDSGGLFGHGSSSKFLKMASTADSATTAYSLNINLLPTPGLTTTGLLSFSFYQPSGGGSYHGDGFILRFGAGGNGNSITACGVGLKNGALYPVTGAGGVGVEIGTTPYATYSSDAPHALKVYFNNSTSAYQYEVSGNIYSLAATTLDVWLDGVRVGVGLARAGGLASDTNINNFNFTSKVNFVGTLFVDDLSAATLPPAAPHDLTASLVNGHASLTWSAMAGASSYTVSRASASGGPYTVIASGLTTNSYLDPSVVSGACYYVVSSVGPAGSGGYSNEASVNPTPATPTGVTALPGDGRIRLGWSAASGAANYRVKVGFSSGGPYTLEQEVSGTSYVDGSLLNGTTYYYVISAANSVAESADSAQVFATPAATVATPTFSLASGTYSSAQNVTISCATSGATMRYTIDGSTPSPSVGVVYTSPVSVAYSQTLRAVAYKTGSLTSMVVGGTYVITPEVVRFTENFDTYTGGSLLLSGTGNWSSVSNATPFQTVVMADSGTLFGHGATSNFLKMASTADSASSGYFLSSKVLSSTVVAGNISFNFYQPSGGSSYHGDGFIFRIGNGGGGNANTAFGLGFKNGALYLASTPSVELASTPLASYSLNAQHSFAIYFNNNASVTYGYTVNGKTYDLPGGTMDIWLDGIRTGRSLGRAGGMGTDVSLNNFNFTSKANFVGTLYLDDIAENGTNITMPAVPTGLAATVSGGQVALSWAAVSGAISYQVRRGATSGGPYNVVADWVTPGTTFTDNPPSPGTYYYVVAASNTGVTGPKSAEVFATVAAPIGTPAAPNGVIAAPGTGQVTLSWAPVNGNSRAADYVVKRATTNGGPYTTIATHVAVPLYQDNGLTNGITYYYVISGTNDLGQSPNSAQVSATPATVSSGTVSFLDNWYADSVRGGWLGNQVMASSRLQLDPNTTTSHGLPAARVEVRPGDDPITSSGERSEVLVMKNGTTEISEDTTTGTQYYAMSYKLPSTWQSTVVSGIGSWSIIWQLHGPDSLISSPSFALYANSAYQLSLNGGDLDSRTVGGPSSALSAIYNFSDGGSLNLGQWTDLVLKVTWAQTTTGSVTIWRRNQGQTSFTQVLNLSNVATLQYRASASPTTGPHYWKHGLYRAKNSATVTNILWMGPLVRATNFAAAEWAAFGTSAGQP